MPKQVYFKISEERRENLLKPALREFTKKSYDKVTVLSLTATMKILRTDFYYYFSDKEDIYGALISDLLQKIKENGGAEDVHEAFISLFNATLKMKGPKNRKYLIELTENYNPQFADEMAKRLMIAFPCGCDPIRKQIKVMIKIYKFMTIVNKYEKGEIDEALAKDIIAHAHQGANQ